MTAANGTAPQIDARELRAARKRTFTAAGKALANLEKIVVQDRVELGNGHVPPQAALRKAADKYLGLLETLDIQDSLLTPEALEAIYAEHEEARQVSVSREDLALLTGVLISSGLVPEGAAMADGPLGRLNAAAHPAGLDASQLALVTIPGSAAQGS
jgi:hypothetical protein